MEQLVARQAHNLEVVGSSPSSATILREIKDLIVRENVRFLIFRLERRVVLILFFLFYVEKTLMIYDATFETESTV